MKPSGPIPPGYGGDAHGRLLIAGHDVASLIERAGDTPLFVYDHDLVAGRVARLRTAMPDGLEIHYAIKANPFAPLVAMMAGIVDGFDVASEGELERAIGAGMSARHISFAGPASARANWRRRSVWARRFIWNPNGKPSARSMWPLHWASSRISRSG